MIYAHVQMRVENEEYIPIDCTLSVGFKSMENTFEYAARMGRVSNSRGW